MAFWNKDGTPKIILVDGKAIKKHLEALKKAEKNGRQI